MREDAQQKRQAELFRAKTKHVNSYKETQKQVIKEEEKRQAKRKTILKNKQNCNKLLSKKPKNLQEEKKLQGKIDEEKQQIALEKQKQEQQNKRMQKRS